MHGLRDDVHALCGGRPLVRGAFGRRRADRVDQKYVRWMIGVVLANVLTVILAILLHPH
jgi:hypothetical protein